jgi:ligand-binding SRPBCC domain-containing protein
MPSITVRQRFAFPVEALFDFFRRPANMVLAAPPELHLQLIEAPEVVEVGSRIVVQIRRWGLSQRIVTEVVDLEENMRIVQEQRHGPFRSLRREQRVSESNGETEVVEEITFEPPGGMLGLVMTASRIEDEMRAGLAYRERTVKEYLRGR